MIFMVPHVASREEINKKLKILESRYEANDEKLHKIVNKIQKIEEKIGGSGLFNFDVFPKHMEHVEQYKKELELLYQEKSHLYIIELMLSDEINSLKGLYFDF